MRGDEWWDMATSLAVAVGRRYRSGLAVGLDRWGWEGHYLYNWGFIWRITVVEKVRSGVVWGGG